MIDAFLLVGKHIWSSLRIVDLSEGIIACNSEQILLKTGKLKLQIKAASHLLHGECQRKLVPFLAPSLLPRKILTLEQVCLLSSFMLHYVTLGADEYLKSLPVSRSWLVSFHKMFSWSRTNHLCAFFWQQQLVAETLVSAGGGALPQDSYCMLFLLNL